MFAELRRRERGRGRRRTGGGGSSAGQGKTSCGPVTDDGGAWTVRLGRVG
jgi:hypothetical protein